MVTVYWTESLQGVEHYRVLTPEKLEASRRLEAFLAFSIGIDRDRFTP